ncbi:uncharacterized protein LOC121388642 [Gigantopelta aegis]|uniref:uncharacterized protein LOC121388642 n=1 Tax=Gigantopelta aegis TaxID=1735272 RepID=UPI001B88D2B1|nr:uncharacterized protein LOC121388642 [Gigantopelta aegis]
MTVTVIQCFDRTPLVHNPRDRSLTAISAKRVTCDNFETSDVSDLKSDATQDDVPTSLKTRPEPLGACDSTSRTSCGSSVDPECLSASSFTEVFLFDYSSGSYTGSQNTAIPDVIQESLTAAQRGATAASSQDIQPPEQRQGSLTLARNQNSQELKRSADNQAPERSEDSLAPERSRDSLTQARSQDSLAPEQSQASAALIDSNLDSISFGSLSLLDDDNICHTPVPVNPDVLILHHENTQAVASRLQTRLNESRLLEKKIIVQLVEEFGRSGATEITNLDDLVEKVACVLLLIDEHFVKDSRCHFYSDVSVFCSLTSVQEYANKDFVIPVFTQNKQQILGMKATMKAMTGIRYHNEEWNDRVELNFINQIKRCLKKFDQLQDKLKESRPEKEA